MIEKQPPHQPGIMHLWLFDQHQVWVDKHGQEFEIEMMPRGYAGNVILMLQNSVLSLYGHVVMNKALEAMESVLTAEAHTPELADAENTLHPQHEDPEQIKSLIEATIEKWQERKGEALTENELEIAENACLWLMSTPLLRALLRRWGPGEVVYTPPPAS